MLKQPTMSIEFRSNKIFHRITRWWFQIFFTFPLKIGRMIPNLTNIFQMGWSNHQPDLLNVHPSSIKALINACVKAGDIPRAERLFKLQNCRVPTVSVFPSMAKHVYISVGDVCCIGWKKREYPLTMTLWWDILGKIHRDPFPRVGILPTWWWL